MSTTALIEPPENTDGLQAGLALTLAVVPVAGPPIFVYAGFGVVLLLLLVPPFALLATLAAVALVLATALVTLVVLARAILEALVLLVRLLRRQRLGHFSLTMPPLDTVRARRV